MFEGAEEGSDEVVVLELGDDNVEDVKDVTVVFVLEKDVEEDVTVSAGLELDKEKVKKVVAET